MEQGNSLGNLRHCRALRIDWAPDGKAAERGGESEDLPEQWIVTFADTR